MNTEKKGQRAKNLIQKKRGGRRKELLSETLTDTQKRYVQLCTKKNVKPTDTLYRALGKNTFGMGLENLDPDEMDILMEFMTKCTTIENIEVSLGVIGLSRDLKSKLERMGFDGPIAATQAISIKLYKGIASMAFKSSTLMKLDLQGLHVFPQSYKILAKAITSSESVTSISFAGTSLGDAGLAALAVAFSHRPHLSHLDLSKCDLTDASVRELSKIVRVHGIRRDEVCWTSSLRGRAPKVGGDGLQLLNIAYNALSDTTVEGLCEVLIQDKFMMGINMSGNKIGPRGIVNIVDLLRHNAQFLVFRLQDSTNADERLVNFVDNLLRKRETEIAAAVSRTTVLESENLCTVLRKWNVHPSLLPDSTSRSVPETEDDDYSAVGSFSAVGTVPQMGPEKSTLPKGKSVSKKQQKVNSKANDKNAPRANLVLEESWDDEISENQLMSTSFHEKEMEKLMKQVQQLKKMATESDKKLKHMSEENSTLRAELRQYKNNSPTKRPSTSKTTSHEDSIMLQLESSIVALANKVQDLEISQQKTPRKSPKTVGKSPKTAAP